MFHSAQLHDLTLPIARVWLASNQERKLSKTQILQQNIQDSIAAIINPNDAPLALRLSGQLLLGVVRIYSRKARYLLDDCNEAITRIKMAFRSTGNHDMPVHMRALNRESLMLEDRITPHDNLDELAGPNLNFLSSQFDDLTTPLALGRKGRLNNNRDINLQEDFSNSQFLTSGDAEEEVMGFGAKEDLGLDLDFGLDIDEGPSRLMDGSIEFGRDAPVSRAVEDDMMFSELGMAAPSKDRLAREPSLGLDLDFGDGVQIADEEGDIRMVDGDYNFTVDHSVAPVDHVAATGPDMSRARISESPLSDIDEEFAREVELEYSRHMKTDMYEPGDDPTASTVVAPQRAKKRKLLQPDEETMLTAAAIKDQQNKRDNILRPQSFLPKDSRMMELMELQKNGGFVNSVFFEGRGAGWAPELRGLLSLGAIVPPELKRKRDSGIADMESDLEQGASKSPRLELPEDETAVPVGGAAAGEQSEAIVDGTMLDITVGEDMQLQDGDISGLHVGDTTTPGPGFDETSAPIVHPADSGPVSIGTKHAVHILRDLFGAEAATNAEKRKKTSVVFQELLPEKKTTKADATKMFFECLVLATKDAIKVEQAEGTLGGPIRVRGKRGLWGEWAEREGREGEATEGTEQARGQEQGQEQTSADVPEPAVASSATVAVEA